MILRESGGAIREVINVYMNLSLAKAGSLIVRVRRSCKNEYLTLKVGKLRQIYKFVKIEATLVTEHTKKLYRTFHL